MAVNRRNPLFIPPRFYENVHFHRHTDRAISWLELFYDLVYVATLIQIGNFLSDNTNIVGFGQFLVLMVVVWWAWTGETFYQNRYVSDDITHRNLVFIQMFAIASLGISVSLAFSDLYMQFAISMIIVRSILVLMYLRAARAHPESRALSMGYAYGFGLGVAIWIGSLLLPPDIVWVGWLVAITLELALPLLPPIRELQYKYSFDRPHIIERFGIFTIIVLGESFVKILDDAQGTPLSLDAFLFSVAGLTLTYSLWWLYFADSAEAEVRFDSRPRAFTWLYTHMPLAASLVMYGVGAKKIFGEAIDAPGEALYGDYRILYTGAVLMYLLSIALIDFTTAEHDGTPHNRRGIVRLIGAAVVAGVGFFVTGITPIALVTVFAAVMVVQVIYSVVNSRLEDDDYHASEPLIGDVGAD